MDIHIWNIAFKAMLIFAGVYGLTFVVGAFITSDVRNYRPFDKKTWCVVLLIPFILSCFALMIYGIVLTGG